MTVQFQQNSYAICCLRVESVRIGQRRSCPCRSTNKIRILATPTFFLVIAAVAIAAGAVIWAFDQPLRTALSRGA
jgi:hypothetical protein